MLEVAPVDKNIFLFSMAPVQKAAGEASPSFTNKLPIENIFKSRFSVWRSSGSGSKNCVEDRSKKHKYC